MYMTDIGTTEIIQWTKQKTRASEGRSRAAWRTTASQRLLELRRATTQYSFEKQELPRFPIKSLLPSSARVS